LLRDVKEGAGLLGEGRRGFGFFRGYSLTYFVLLSLSIDDSAFLDRKIKEATFFAAFKKVRVFFTCEVNTGFGEEMLG
jgi:hypothetical protein